MAEKKKPSAKKKVIKVGVGKPFIRGGKPFTSLRGTRDRTGKLKTTLNAIDTIFKQETDKKITRKERQKMIAAVLKAPKDQIKNKTYGKP